MEKVRCMKDLPIFSNLDWLEKEKIGRLAGKKLYRKKEFIFREGQPADSIYLVKYGRVRLFKVSAAGKEIALGILKENDIFGENTFFDSTEYTMSAQAIEDTFVCSCSREHLPLLLQNPLIAAKIIQFLGKKIQDYTDQVADIAFRDVKERTLTTIMRLAEDYGKKDERGTAVDIELTHQDLASLVNASRVMVSNVLTALRKEGIIATDNRRITILHRKEQDTEKIR